MPGQDTFQAGDVIWIRPGTPSSKWFDSLGPFLFVRDEYNGYHCCPEVCDLDGCCDVARTDYHPHVRDEDIYRDEFLTAVRRATQK